MSFDSNEKSLFWSIVRFGMCVYVLNTLFESMSIEIGIVFGIILSLIIILNTVTKDNYRKYLLKAINFIKYPLLVAIILNVTNILIIAGASLVVTTITFSVWLALAFLIKKVQKIVIPSIWGGVSKLVFG